MTPHQIELLDELPNWQLPLRQFTLERNRERKLEERERHAMPTLDKDVDDICHAISVFQRDMDLHVAMKLKKSAEQETWSTNAEDKAKYFDASLRKDCHMLRQGDVVGMYYDDPFLQLRIPLPFHLDHD